MGISTSDFDRFWLFEDETFSLIIQKHVLLILGVDNLLQNKCFVFWLITLKALINFCPDDMITGIRIVLQQFRCVLDPVVMNEFFSVLIFDILNQTGDIEQGALLRKKSWYKYLFLHQKTERMSQNWPNFFLCGKTSIAQGTKLFVAIEEDGNTVFRFKSSKAISILAKYVFVDLWVFDICCRFQLIQTLYGRHSAVGSCCLPRDIIV